MSVNAPNNDLGWLAKDFSLLNVDNNFLSLEEIKGKNGTVIAFICNHCPYVIKIASRLAYEANELKKNEISTIAIMSNDVESYPEDSYENMKIFASKYNFKFQYLYDSSQKIAKEYKAVCTPDIYGFNSQKILKYRGRIDSGVLKKNNKMNRDLFEAMKLIAKTNEGPAIQYNSFGCSIKWKNNE